MANIHTLSNPHFSRMSHDERFELIRTLRADRRVVKEKPVAEKPTAKKRTRKTVITNELAGMSQEQLAQLMELMSDASTD